MAHIALPEGFPGITGGLAFRPETAGPLRELAEALLRGPGTLTLAEREIIAAFVSSRNNCHFCYASHRAAAAHLMGGDYSVVDAVNCDPLTAPVSIKFRALLAIASKVQQGGAQVSPAEVEAARIAGATDVEVHDTVLIAAAFCMFNRYVNGLAMPTPTDEPFYDQMGRRMAEEGYVQRPDVTHAPSLVTRARIRD